ncbi:uncharacterized protein KIAA1958-like [Haliotis rufescens]|uniref:uncharacterized protein KIAA1958-like n=1 Tax=Haliotis rufescens TaxID=6454 RepID=UPI00201F7011|nr:uncharacterized protein KIAA1958-like [Haliotis rufescens]
MHVLNYWRTTCIRVVERNLVRMGDNMSDCGDELFVTQNTFCNQSDVVVNSHFETLLYMDNFQEDYCQNFELGRLFSDENTDTAPYNTSQDNFDDNCDTELYLASQMIEESGIIGTRVSKRQLHSEILDSLKGDNESFEKAVQVTQLGTNLDNEKLRFGTPLSETDMVHLCDSAYSVNTEHKSRWALNIFKNWVVERQKRSNNEIPIANQNIVSLAEDENDLNRTLMLFLSEVRNQKREEYRGNTLYEIVSSLQYYLRRNGVVVNFFESSCYTGMRSVLDAKMKLLARKGIGVEKRQADVITEQQEDVLWETGILGEDTPQKLLDTLVYLIGLNFALRAGDEHRYLRSGSNSQLQLLMSSNGVKQLKYTEDISKTNRGG